MPQYARPSSDVTTTNWTRSSGTAAYYTYIDEASADDADYVQTQSQGSALVVGLSAVTDPVSSTGHIVRARVWAAGGAAGKHMSVGRPEFGVRS